MIFMIAVSQQKYIPTHYSHLHSQNITKIDKTRIKQQCCRRKQVGEEKIHGPGKLAR